MRYLYIDNKALNVLFSKYTTYPLYHNLHPMGKELIMEEREVFSRVLIFLSKYAHLTHN